MAKKAKKELDPTLSVYQLKISLQHISSLIWRRIQVKGCTLDKLHQHIQTAMGWQSCHLYQFTINGKGYSHPEIWQPEFEEIEDATQVRLRELMPESSEQFQFVYGYDFGDGWRHDILLGGCLCSQEGGRYPLCLDGARACPPRT